MNTKFTVEIVQATGASTATISRVNRSLSYGCDGYQVVFDRVKVNERVRSICLVL